MHQLNAFVLFSVCVFSSLSLCRLFVLHNYNKAHFWNVLVRRWTHTGWHLTPITTFNEYFHNIFCLVFLSFFDVGYYYFYFVELNFRMEISFRSYTLIAFAWFGGREWKMNLCVENPLICEYELNAHFFIAVLS